MKIEIAPRKSTFKDFEEGEIFKYEFEGDAYYCIKFENPFTEYNALCISDGNCFVMKANDKVSPVKAKLVVEE